MHRNDLLDLLLRIEAAAQRRGWEARPGLLVVSRRGADLHAELTGLPSDTDVGDWLEQRAITVGLHPSNQALFVAELGPDAYALGLMTEAWGLFDATAIAQANNDRGPRPVSRHPRCLELRCLWVAVPARDLCLQRIRGSEPSLLYDSANSPWACG